ncbi:MAG: aldo/keto reductase [Dermatophilaceae bacterium]
MTRSQRRLPPGYRHIDTAAAYGNERQVGEAAASSGIPRSDIFLETKIWISDYGYDQTLHGFEKSARKLGVGQIDLLILHQPLPTDFEATLEASGCWRRCWPTGRRGPSGSANVMVEHLTALLDRATVVPAVNQIEVHPYFAQRGVQAFGAEHGILTRPGARSAASPSTATATTAARSPTRSSAASPRPTGRRPPR